ncbi:MAG TPA: NAD(P)H-binding protein [Streptosporangiaceae bacterium]|jgi:putative NADH-flavin reductase
MKLTIFGATGGTGTHVVEQALSAGHEVTAVVRDPARLRVADRARVTAGAGVPGPAGSQAPRLRVVTADAMDPAAITGTVADADAVICTLGPRGTGPTTVVQDGHRSIIAAMQRAGTRRLLSVSGSIAADDGESLYMRYLVKPLARATFLRHVCADFRTAETAVRASGLDWTIFRPPALSNRPASGSYRTAIDRNLPHGFTVPRADLAACMLGTLTDPAAIHRHIGIAS